MDPASISALTFDVFGTVVDWRSSIIREGQAFGTHRSLSVDWAKFADAWRGLYQPAMEEVRSGRRPWARLDDLHRESLVRLLRDFGIEGLSPAEIDDLNRAWHRLDPCPDAVAGRHRPNRRCVLATLSYGTIALMGTMATGAGLRRGGRARGRRRPQARRQRGDGGGGGQGDRSPRPAVGLPRRPLGPGRGPRRACLRRVRAGRRAGEQRGDVPALRPYRERHRGPVGQGPRREPEGPVPSHRDGGRAAGGGPGRLGHPAPEHPGGTAPRRRHS